MRRANSGSNQKKALAVMPFRIRSRRAAAPQASTPEGTVVYAIGDVHGYLDLLRGVEAHIREDMAARTAGRRVVVYLGDYVDRGPASCGVIEHLLRSPLSDCEPVHLSGNHEQWLLRFLDDPSVGPAWLRNGGRETLASYGVSVPYQVDAEGMAAVQRAFTQALPASHRKFLEDMPLCHQEGDYFFAHAGVRPGVPLDEQSPQDLVWIREEFLYSTADFGAVVVHGHTPTHTPEEHPNRVGIDTGAFMSGILTGLVLDGEKRSFFYS